MVARMAATSTCRENCKKPMKPILTEDPKENLLFYVPLFPPLPPPYIFSPPFPEGGAASDKEAPSANTFTRPSPGTATTLLSSGPMSLMLTLSPPILIPQLPERLAPRFNQEHLNSPTIGLVCPPEPTTLQMCLREVQAKYITASMVDTRSKVNTHLRALPTTDLLNWKQHTFSFMEKPQALIYLMQSIIQTHKPSWTAFQQLLLTYLILRSDTVITMAALR
jgi:hypothetical protein